MEGRDVLERGSRCLLGLHGARGPVLSPMAYWFDGTAVWMSTPARSVKVSALARDAHCALYVAPAGDEGPGAVASGRARVFSARDPRGLVLHGPTISAAVAVLALRNATSIAGYLADAPRIPSRFLPRNRVVVRVVLDDVEAVFPPALTPGIAPALPTVVPPDVRRALAGRRRVVLGILDGDRVRLTPAVWRAGTGAGLPLSLPLRFDVAHDAPATVALDADGRGRPTEVAGLALSGSLTRPTALLPERVTWWHGFELSSADVPTAATSATITLPD